MSCNSAEKLFDRFLDDELAAPLRSVVITHVDTCVSCRSLLEELRVVDALLTEPRQIELAPNFTFSTMAEARALPAPVRATQPIRAYVCTYLVASWLLAGAAYLVAPFRMRALTGTTFSIAREIASALCALGAVIARILNRDGNLVAIGLSALLLLEVALVVGCGLAWRSMRPRRTERVSS